MHMYSAASAAAGSWQHHLLHSSEDKIYIEEVQATHWDKVYVGVDLHGT